MPPSPVTSHERRPKPVKEPGRIASAICTSHIRARRMTGDANRLRAFEVLCGFEVFRGGMTVTRRLSQAYPGVD